MFDQTEQLEIEMFLINCVIALNRTVYLYKNGFSID